MAKELEKEYIYIHTYIHIYITEALCYTPETNSIVKQLWWWFSH